MPFSWRGLLIAPLVAPVIFGAAIAIFIGNGSLVLRARNQVRC
jgi:hypothetical protein